MHTFFEGQSLKLVLKVRLHESTVSCLRLRGLGSTGLGVKEDELQEAARLQVKGKLFGNNRTTCPQGVRTCKHKATS